MTDHSPPRPHGAALLGARSLAAALLVSGVSLAAQPRYTVVDLGLGSGARPEAINELGEIVGRRSVSGASRIFVHDPRTGVATDPGLPAGATHAFPRDLNESGHIVGNAWDQPIGQPGRSFLFTPGVGMRDLGELTPGGKSTAFAVDNSGNVGGAADGSAFSMEAFSWPAGGPMVPVRAGSVGSVAALADRGWMVGSLGPFARSPFFVDPAGALRFVPVPAATPHGGAAAVSENGWIAGVMYDPSGTVREAFRYHAPSGRFDALGLVSRVGAVHGVDSEGTVVGFRQVSTRVDPVAFVSFGGGPLVDLDTLLAPAGAWRVLRAKGINESGQICATARSGLGPDVLVRLDPVRTSGTAGSATTVETGCSGIELRAGPPRTGRPWSLALRGAGAGRALTVFASVGHPAPVGLPGLPCAVHVAPAGVVGSTGGTANPLGAWARVFDVPPDPRLVGGTMTFQAVVLDPAAPVVVRPSSAVRLRIGD